MIHINDVRRILQDGKPFNCRIWKKNGTIMNCNNVVCSSSNYSRSTANLIFMDSNQIRTVRVIAIFEVSDEEVIL
jgi:hypothetical protein